MAAENCDQVKSIAQKPQKNLLANVRRRSGTVPSIAPSPESIVAAFEARSRGPNRVSTNEQALTERVNDVRQHGHCRSGVAGVVKLLIHKIE
jgi:hypothetical protein